MDLPEPPVTVITPVYNGQPFLSECIESVLGQRYENWRYVIVDNASDDGSGELAESFAGSDPRIELVHNPETLPFIENWNLAMRQVPPESDYCKVVHADDRLRPDCLRRMVWLAERHAGVDVVGAYVKKGEEVVCRWADAPGEVIPGRELARLSLLGEVPYLFGSPSALLIRSGRVRDRDPFYQDERSEVIAQVVDQEACYHLLQRGDFGYVPDVLTSMREHDESITAESEELGRWYPGKLALLLAYGPIFLADDEFREKREEWLERYYDFLVKSMRHGRAPEFWRYHRRALATLDLSFEPLRFGRTAGRFVMESVRRRAASLLSTEGREVSS